MDCALPTTIVLVFETLVGLPLAVFLLLFLFLFLLLASGCHGRSVMDLDMNMPEGLPTLQYWDE